VGVRAGKPIGVLVVESAGEEVGTSYLVGASVGISSGDSARLMVGTVNAEAGVILDVAVGLAAFSSTTTAL